MSVGFIIAGQEFTALNGGQHYQFTEAISFVVNCQTQDEVDFFGNGSRPKEKKCSAAGWKTDSACPGKSFPPR